MSAVSIPTLNSELRSSSVDPLTIRARTIWSGADFLPIARSFADGASAFIDRLDVAPGERVVDVACGTGNLAIPAARAGARVTGIDIAANLIAEARLEARSAGLNVAFEVGDAEQLPYGDGQFDTAVSMFGVMFTYRPERAAREILRVTRSGGRVALANWTSAGFIGKLLRAHVAVVPPPTGIPSPLAWGSKEGVGALMGERVSSLRCEQREIHLRFPFPPAAVTELFAAHYGPTLATLRATDAAGASRLRDSITALFDEHNLATDGTTDVAGEYLDVLARVI